MDIKNINVGGNEYDVCDAPVRAMVSDGFKEGKDYIPGEICIQNNALYVFDEQKSAGPWDESKVHGTTLAELYSSLNSSITVKEFSVSKKVAANEQASVTFNGEIIPDGYSVIAARCSAGHVATLCGCPIVQKNIAYLPYISKSAEESEGFKLYVTLQRIS